MVDQPPHIPNHNAEGHRDLTTPDGDGRAMFATHTIVQNGRMLTVHPALGLTLGSMRSHNSPNYVPTIRIDGALTPHSLVFVPTAADLIVLGQEMMAIGAKMEADAAAMLDKVIGKKGAGE